MEELGLSRGDRVLELAGMVTRATALVAPVGRQDIPEARAVSNRALTLARDTGDALSESKILWNLLLADNFSGDDPGRAVRFGEESLSLAHRAGSLQQIASTSHDLHWAYRADGRTQEALRVLNEALALWSRLGDKAMLGDGLACSSGLKLFAGDFEGAIQDSRQAVAVSEQTGNLWGQSFSRMYVGAALFELGRVEEAIAEMEATLRLADKSGAPALRVGTRGDLGLLLTQIGDPDAGLAIAKNAVELARSVPAPLRDWAVASLVRILGPVAGGGSKPFPLG